MLAKAEWNYPVTALKSAPSKAKEKMRRKASNEVRGHRTKAELAARRALESAQGEPGLPPRRQGQGRAWRDRWHYWVGVLYNKRLLLTSDGAALNRLIDLEVLQDKNGMADVMESTWANRAPWPSDPQTQASAPATNTLQEFLVSVQRERATFTDRLDPALTVVEDFDGPYAWPEGDAATVARQYCLSVVAGNIVAGDLLKKACARSLDDLDTGADAGLYFDPVAAQHICDFAERFCKLKLMAWQVWVLSSIFGWKKPSGLRRFTEAWVSMAKKNGKTALASTIGLWGLLCDMEAYPEIYSTATKKEQARLIWRDAKRAVTDHEELRAAVKRWAGELAVEANDGTFSPLSSDTKSLDGLRPHFALFDEVHEFDSRENFDKVAKGTVSRVQPLIFSITTAGSSKQCFAWGKFDLASKILRGVLHAPETFVAIYEIDKGDVHTDESCWPKANPSLGVTLHVDNLRKQINELKEDPTGLNNFLRYHLNVWIELTLSKAAPSIPSGLWAACSGLEHFPGCHPMQATEKFLLLNRDTPCVGGLDIGLKNDLSCFLLLFPYGLVPNPEGADKEPVPVAKRFVVSSFWMPELNLLEKEKHWRVPLSQWVREGFIDAQPGDTVDTDAIREQMLSTFSLGPGSLQCVGFDYWNAGHVVKAILESKGEESCVAVPQTPGALSVPAKDFMRSVFKKELAHFMNPVMAWMAGNVVLEESPKHGGIKPEKRDDSEKIDGISALLCAWNRLLVLPPPSVYSTRGLILLGD
jgi:phage terminase large subunit-like protein